MEGKRLSKPPVSSLQLHILVYVSEVLPHLFLQFLDKGRVGVVTPHFRANLVVLASPLLGSFLVL